MPLKNSTLSAEGSNFGLVITGLRTSTGLDPASETEVDAITLAATPKMSNDALRIEWRRFIEKLLTTAR